MAEAQPPLFVISSFCQGGGCVGVALGGDQVQVRSTLVVDGPVLAFNTASWADFVHGIDAPGDAERV